MRNWLVQFHLIAFIITGQSLLAQTIRQPIFFKITAPTGKISYLLGSFHLGVGIDEFPAFVLQAQNETEIQIGEANMISSLLGWRHIATQPQEAVEALIRDRPPAALEAHRRLSERQIRQLVELQIPEAVAKELDDRECFTIFARQFLFSETPHFLDGEFQERAQRMGRPIFELNTKTISERAREIDQAQNPARECSITDLLADPARRRASERSMIRFRTIYRNLTFVSAAENFSQPDAAVEYQNQAWMPALRRLLTDHSAFLTIGLKHLYGPNNLIDLLRGSGFHVEEHVE